MPFKKTNKVFAILCGCLLLASPIAMAKTQTIEATGSYQMGENDSIASAKKNAKEDAMRIAAEQAGVYVRSYSKTKNLKLTDDQVEVISIQTMQVKDCKFRQEYKNNIMTVYASIKAAIDDSDFQKRIDANNKIQDLQTKLDQEKAKNQDELNRKLQKSGKDPMAAAIVEQNLKTFMQNYRYAGSIRKNFADFANERNGIIPADIYGRMALLDLCGSSAFYQEDIDNAIQIEPNDPFYYTIQGLYCINNQDYFGAEAFADQAVRLDKRYWPAYYIRSIAKAFRGSTRKAIEDCNAAIKRGGSHYGYVMNYRAKLERVFAGRHSNVDFTADDYNSTVLNTIKGFYRDADKLKKQKKK